jgi:hypothetical protein
MFPFPAETKRLQPGFLTQGSNSLAVFTRLHKAWHSKPRVNPVAFARSFAAIPLHYTTPFLRFRFAPFRISRSVIPLINACSVLSIRLTLELQNNGTFRALNALNPKVASRPTLKTD